MSVQCTIRANGEPVKTARGGQHAEEIAEYAPHRWGSHVDLRLDANEGPGGLVDVDEVVARLGKDAARRYPSAAGLEELLGKAIGVPPSCVLVTAGADEAIDRACRAFLKPGEELLLPTPTFEMFGKYARLAGATVVSIPWLAGPYPIDKVIGLTNVSTAMIAVVSPNNPTGAVATARDLERLAESAPDTVLLIDLAYTEYADEDLTRVALKLPNAVVIRTFSKAMGLAGMRVGYAIGPEALIRSMRAAGSPYPVSNLSLACAETAVKAVPNALPNVVQRVRFERERISQVLVSLGARPRPTFANFVLAEFDNAEWTWRALAGLGIGVRRFNNNDDLSRSLRISCPGDEGKFDRLCAALGAALRPQALLLDMDGVVADVSGSYRRAIELTALTFGVRVTQQEIEQIKSEGDANNDWVVTTRVLETRGISKPLREVAARFEELYYGTGSMSGLAAFERLIPAKTLLERLAERMPVAIVTGRPRRDCREFLERFGLTTLFSEMVCMEDASAKPSPEPVRLALDRLGVAAAWLVGDTPDDINAARAAGVVPLGIAPPGGNAEVMTTALERAGAARILTALSDLEEMIP